MKQFTLKVQEIKQQTQDAITLCFKQPGLRKVKYIAGQYITLISNINGRKYARPYSFSSAPSVDAYLEITVKRVQNGIFSNHINNNVKVGDVFEILEPMGDFIYDSSKVSSEIYLWGVGSGITPLYSIIKEILWNTLDTKVFLIYGNKNEETSIFHDELEKLQQKFNSVFQYISFYSQQDVHIENEKFKKGRINTDFIKEFLIQNESIDRSMHYICGPRELKETITNALLELNVPKSSILTEEFHLNIDSSELEEVEESNAVIYFKGMQNGIFIPKGKNVLDAALDAGIDLPYSCQTGKCNTCKAIIKKGQLKTIGIENKRDDLDINEFLLCCSYPLTSEIILEVR